MKTAIINAGDTGAVEATAYMLNQVGYDCFLPSLELQQELRRNGISSDDVQELAARFAYDPPRLPIWNGSQTFVDLFVDLKAHVTYPRIKANWPHWRVLWLCINGGDPQKRTDGAPWADPPCPVLTHNQWYGSALYTGNAYTCFPPYQKIDRHYRIGCDGPPVCLVHNVERWGYEHAVLNLHKLGVVRFYGGNSPDGLIDNQQCVRLLSTTKAMVLVKCGDAVGFSTVEAMVSACPVVCTQHYIDETKLHALLEPGITCLTFDQRYPVESVKAALDVLSSKPHNQRIGQNGKDRLVQLMWQPERDLPSFKAFMERHYG